MVNDVSQETPRFLVNIPRQGLGAVICGKQLLEADCVGMHCSSGINVDLHRWMTERTCQKVFVFI